jgi:CheY-like chemotaxis protein
MNKDVKFLIVDDDEVDLRALKRGIHKQKISNPIFEAHNGLEALDILRGTVDQQPLKAPFVILLDLNMPKMNGIEFLAEMRADPKLGHHLVFVLTTSADDEDKLNAYKSHVAGYILKSDAGANFLKLVEMMEKYTLTVQFPPGA